MVQKIRQITWFRFCFLLSGLPFLSSFLHYDFVPWLVDDSLNPHFRGVSEIALEMKLIFRNNRLIVLLKRKENTVFQQIFYKTL